MVLQRNRPTGCIYREIDYKEQVHVFMKADQSHGPQVSRRAGDPGKLKVYFSLKSSRLGIQEELVFSFKSKSRKKAEVPAHRLSQQPEQIRHGPLQKEVASCLQARGKRWTGWKPRNGTLPPSSRTESTLRKGLSGQRVGPYNAVVVQSRGGRKTPQHTFEHVSTLQRDSSLDGCLILFVLVCFHINFENVPLNKNPFCLIKSDCPPPCWVLIAGPE